MTTKTKDLEAVVGRSDLLKIDPKEIKIQDGWNPRAEFGDIQTLANDIKENGLLVPIRIKRVGDDLVVVDGERRMRAVKLLLEQGVEIKAVPAMLISGKGDSELMFEALSTNTGKPLTFSEEAEAFRRLVAWGVTQSDIARRIGRDPAYVSARMTFVNNATPEVKQAVAENKISKSTAMAIANKNDAAKQSELLAKAQSSTLAVKANGETPKAPRLVKTVDDIKKQMAANSQYGQCEKLMDDIGGTMNLRIEKGEYIIEQWSTAKHDYMLMASKKRNECKIYTCDGATSTATKVAEIERDHK